MYLRISHKVHHKNWTLMVNRLLGYYVEDLSEAASHGVDITDVTQHEFESERERERGRERESERGRGRERETRHALWMALGQYEH